MSIVNVSAKQTAAGPTYATVHVTYTLTAPVPDNIQIGYQPTGENQADYTLYRWVPFGVDKSKANQPVTQTLNLPPQNQYYVIMVCPQDPSSTKPQDWFSSCSLAAPVRVTGYQDELPPDNSLPAPTITGVDRHPATLERGAYFTVHWSSSHQYDLYHVIQTWPGGNWQQSDDLRNSESWDSWEVVAGQTFTFKVQGCDQDWLRISSSCSPWSPDYAGVVHNDTGLRQFLKDSGYDPTTYPVRANVMNSGGSVRKFMKVE